MPIDHLLLETGDALLTEQGGFILLEPATIDPSEVVGTRIGTVTVKVARLGTVTVTDNGD